MDKPIRVLIIEDSEDDMKLLLRALRHGGFDPAHRRVQSAAELASALANERWDAVVSDFAMPGFSGMDALRMFRATGLDIPFILVSGTVGEASAVDAMKAGASDYVMKGSLVRLVPALERELKETQIRAAHRQAQRDLVASEARFRSLSALSSDWFWEQDEAYRFVKFSGGDQEGGWGSDQLSAVGLRRWELPGVAPVSGSWDEHKALLEAHKPFRNFEYRRILGDGSLQYVAGSGEPVFDAGSRFTGYRGVATDITERKRSEHELQRFRAAMDISADAIVLVDRASMRYIDVNQTFCDTTGLTRQEVLGMTPMDLIGQSREKLESDCDAVIADNNSSESRVEDQFRRKDGSIMQIEMRRRALHTETGWIIVSTIRDITESKAAEAKIVRLNRVYAVLSGINSAIVRIQERGELFAEACRIAVTEGGFIVARVLELDSNGTARIAATSEPDSLLYQRIVDEYNSDPEHCGSVLALALHGGQPQVSNDVATDPRIPNRAVLTKDGTYSLALLPMIVDKRVAGVIVLRARDAGMFDQEELRLLLELTGNISLALDRIEKEEKLVFLAAERARNEEALRRFSTAMDATVDAIYIVDRESMRFVHVNEAACRMQGRTREELLALGPEGVLSIPRAELERTYDAMIASGVPAEPKEMLRVRKDGSQAWVELRRHAQRSTEGWTIVTLVRDITERKAADAKIKRLNRVYAVLSGINTLIVRSHDRDELFREACRIAVEQGGFGMAWIGIANRDTMMIDPIASAGAEPEFLALIRDRFSLRDDAPMGNTMTARAIREKKAIVSNDLRTASNVQFLKERMERGIASLAILPLLVADEAVGVLCLYAGEKDFFDAEEMKLLTELAGDIAFAVDHIGKQARLDYLAFYDELTGLANRGLFLERVTQYVRGPAAGGRKFALFFIDLERFKNINESLGRQAGDALLKQVAGLLTSGEGDPNLVARVGSDHFAVVMPEIKHKDDVVRFLDDRIDRFQEHPFHLNDGVFRIAMKVGVALFPDDGADAETLLRNAESALKKAKSRGERYVFYKQKMTDKRAGKLSLENKLRSALEKEEYVLHYQPKVNLQTGKLTSAEALIRWNDPQTGLVPPGHFIPILEETGLIHDVGRWALRRALEDYLRWRAAGLPAVRIAVNVSPLQLRDHGFIAEVGQAIGIDPLAPEGLELEITESVIMADVKHSIASLQAIRDMRVTIAIDDFGTGFSSLAYLAKLPVDTLKIDRSFVVDMTTGPDGLSLVSTIINLAHALKLKVVAEGVETEEQARLLRLLNCNEMQGYLFSRPVPAEVFEEKFLAQAPAG